MKGTWKLSVRLTDEERVLLQTKCAERGCDASSLVRQILNLHLNSAETAGQQLVELHHRDGTRSASPVDLAAEYRALGPEISSERLDLFRRLLVCSHVVMERSKNTQDEKLAKILVNLRREYGLS